MSRSNRRTALRKRASRVWVAMAVITAGSAFLAIPSCEGLLTTFNPCGTVLDFCQPYELQALFADVPDFSLDPTCSVPFYGIRTGDTGGSCGTNFIYTQTPGPRPQGQQP